MFSHDITFCISSWIESSCMSSLSRRSLWITLSHTQKALSSQGPVESSFRSKENILVYFKHFHATTPVLYIYASDVSNFLSMSQCLVFSSSQSNMDFWFLYIAIPHMLHPCLAAKYLECQECYLRLIVAPFHYNTRHHSSRGATCASVKKTETNLVICKNSKVPSIMETYTVDSLRQRALPNYPVFSPP